MELTAGNKRKSTNNITIHHQNTLSIINKSDESSINLQMNHIRPHLICLTEHHLKESEITKFTLDGYKLASSFCRREFLGGGVCIFISYNIIFQTIDLKQFCHEKTLEICAVKLHLKSVKLIIFCIYRAPAGNLKQFYDTMDNILNQFLQPNVTYLICSDLNINLFTKSNDALKLITLMNTFNLTQVVDFPTRIINNNGTLIDTIFVDTTIYDKIRVKPFTNGLSDHDAQIIYLQNANIGLQQNVSKKKSRLINEQTIKYFQSMLKDETWDTVYESTCINEMFSRFQDFF
jgi:hypothetical protein